jgi:hypothetical protein
LEETTIELKEKTVDLKSLSKPDFVESLIAAQNRHRYYTNKFLGII